MSHNAPQPADRGSRSLWPAGFHSVVVVRRLLAAALAAGLFTPLHAQTNTLSGTVALSSQLVDRGVAITPVTPIAQGAINWSSASGWALGLSASTETRDLGHSSEALAQVAHYWSLSDDWRMQAGLSYYAYPGNPAGRVFDRTETSVNWMYRDVLTFGLSAICLTRGNDQHPRGAADVDFHWPLPWHLSFSAGAGVTQALHVGPQGGYAGPPPPAPPPVAPSPPYADPPPSPPPGPPRTSSYYGYGHVGLIWAYGPWQVELDRIATAPNIGRQWGGLVAAPWVATISRSF
jgi:uncharacterized protein (TIGR02001 family)